MSRKQSKTTTATSTTTSASNQLALHSSSSNQHQPSSSSSNQPHSSSGDNLDPFDHLNMFQNQSGRMPTPKDDYILPQSTHPINGTFRNPPGDENTPSQHTLSTHLLNTPFQHTLKIPAYLTHPINVFIFNSSDKHLIEKLRHALLRMTRDKYRSGKREKILNTHIDNLKVSMYPSDLTMCCVTYMAR